MDLVGKTPAAHIRVSELVSRSVPVHTTSYRGQAMVQVVKCLPPKRETWIELQFPTSAWIHASNCGIWELSLCTSILLLLKKKKKKNGLLLKMWKKIHTSEKND